jgi:hypothetical protein
MYEVVEVSSSKIERKTLFTVMFVWYVSLWRGWPEEPLICFLDRQYARKLSEIRVQIESMR